MSVTVVRTQEAWWRLASDGSARRIPTGAGTTAELLADRGAVAAAGTEPATTRIDELDLLSPVTVPCRVVAQMANYTSHARDSGMDPTSLPLTFFRKASGSITGPTGDVVRPEHVGLLDYEIEVGLVIGRTIPVGAAVTDANAAEYIAGFVLANDVSARDVQLSKTQFYEAKSYPTFTPVGPRLVLLEEGDFRRLDELRLCLRVNGEVRQDSTVADMIYRPGRTLSVLSRFQRVDPGDLVLTGTPGGTALKAPPKPVEMIGALLPPATKWRIFFGRQSRNPAYLRDGDLMELTAATPDGALDLGVQRCRVRASSRTPQGRSVGAQQEDPVRDR